jgi:hypothetical protein
MPPGSNPSPNCRRPAALANEAGSHRGSASPITHSTRNRMGIDHPDDHPDDPSRGNVVGNVGALTQRGGGSWAARFDAALPFSRFVMTCRMSVTPVSASRWVIVISCRCEAAPGSALAVGGTNPRLAVLRLAPSGHASDACSRLSCGRRARWARTERACLTASGSSTRMRR